MKTASTTSISVQGIEKTTTRVFIEHLVSAVLALSPQAIEYMVHGAGLMRSQWAREVRGLDPYNVVSLIAKLFEAYNAPFIGDEENRKVDVHILQGDAEILMKLLELNMREMEEQRASANTFDSTLYIELKLLWFELKDIVMGTVLPYPADEPRVRTPKGHDVPDYSKSSRVRAYESAPGEDIEQGEGEDGNRAAQGVHQ